MPLKKLTDFLDSNNVRYLTLTHSPAYTSQEIAAAAHIPGRELAKCVMVKLNGRMVMAVLPASYEIDFDQLKTATEAENIELAEEQEFTSLFPECEIGAMPPFGNLWDLEVLVSETIAENEEIAFEAGSHQEIIQLRYDDFERLVKPQVLSFDCKIHPSKEEMQQGAGC